MIPAANPAYRQALAAAHEPYSRVEVWQSGILVEELALTSPDAQTATGAPVFLGGSVRATLNSRVTRTLSLTVPDWLYPWNASDLLNPYGQVLKVFRGIRYGSGLTDEFPVFVGPISDVKPSSGGTATVNAGDLASDVVGFSFSAPSVASVGSPLGAEVKRLITDALPDATYGRFDAFNVRVPALSYDVDRGAALDGLATVGGAYWYSLAGGDFVLRVVPWTTPVTTGALPLTNIGGSLLSAFPLRSRANVFSRITVSNEPSNGAAPFHATVDDTDPTSPTYVHGPYGVKAAQVRITQAATQGACLQAAQSLLKRSKALTESWSITCVCDGSIELGDPLDLLFRDRSSVDHQAVQLVAGYTLPLDHQPMTIDGRAVAADGAQ